MLNKLSLVLTIIAIKSVAGEFCDCGLEQSAKHTLGKYPWRVDLELSYKQKGASFFSKAERMRCTGVIVDSKTIYTMQSCFLGDIDLFYENVQLKITMYIGSKSKEITLKSLNLKTDKSTSVTAISLPEPLEFSEKFMPICTEGSIESDGGEKFTLVGRGLLPGQDKKISSQFPFEADIAVTGDLLKEQDEYKLEQFRYCPSDRGTPLMYKKNGRWFLKGLFRVQFDDCQPEEKLPKNKEISALPKELEKRKNGCQE